MTTTTMESNNSVSGQVDASTDARRGNDVGVTNDHVRSSEQNQQWEAGHDPAVTKRIHFDVRLGFSLGRAEHGKYMERFPKLTIRRMSWAQVAMGVLIATIQMTTMCLMRYYTSLESMGAGIWSSAIAILAAQYAHWACEKTTYMRLYLALVFHLMSAIGSSIMLVVAIGDSIPYQRRNLYTEGYDYYTNLYFPRAATKESVSALVLTSVMTFVGIFQAIISIIVMGRAALAICARSFKVEFKVTGLGKKEKYGEEIALAKHEEGTKPPAYDDLATLGHQRGNGNGNDHGMRV